jgi:hypothetical protein
MYRRSVFLLPASKSTQTSAACGFTRLRVGRLPIKKIADLKTVGIKLSKEQAIHLARVLLAASQDWKEIDVTAWRVYKRRSDNTYNVTVTSAIKS